MVQTYIIRYVTQTPCLLHLIRATQAIQLNPSYAKAYANRGITLVRMGDQKGAIADLQQAARLFRAQGMAADAQKALDLIGQLQK